MCFSFSHTKEKIFDLKPYLKYHVFKPLQDKGISLNGVVERILVRIRFI